MSQIIVRSADRDVSYQLTKPITTFGSDRAHDVLIQGAAGGLGFSIVKEGNRFFVLPGTLKLLLNGKSIFFKSMLQSCDQIKCDQSVIVFVQSEFNLESGSTAQRPGLIRSLETLNNIASVLQTQAANPSDFGVQMEMAIQQALDAFVQIAGAEEGYLLTEIKNRSEWKWIASSEIEENRSSTQKRRELLSSTIVQQAIETQSPVYIESIIGHPLASAASVISARIFSVACIPLILADQIFGVVFLLTRSPGRIIQQDCLGDLKVLASQAALMLASSVELRRMRNENDELRSQIKAPASRLTFDPSETVMTKLDQQLTKIANSPLDVYITGETGTGKELIAKEIHARGARSKGPFVAVNCAAIPSTLLESTLFGYAKGSFTGAHQDHEGKFSQANGGTVFLDEIGDLPIELQAKLLRVLQERVVDPIGAKKPISIDVRIITASHQNLEAMIKEQRFRQDLYFRINSVTVKVPPLRERKKDIVILAEYFLKRTKTGRTLGESALTALKSYTWPGNVRELEHVMTRSAFLADENEISDLDLGLPATGATSGGFDAAFLEKDFVDLDSAQIAFTTEYVQRWLKKCDGNRLEAARRLGISERTLYRIIAQS
jgi:transcriptional regulator with GAF, ATPase, and Fis domain